tara:strand:- start:717 stop:986 length:270 start_codon:yes stop_codon:yes gene_type:complete
VGTLSSGFLLRLPLLGVESSGAPGTAGARGPALGRRRPQVLGEQGGELLEAIVAIATLRAVARGAYDQCPVGGQARSEGDLESRSLIRA